MSITHMAQQFILMKKYKKSVLKCTTSIQMPCFYMCLGIAGKVEALATSNAGKSTIHWYNHAVDGFF